MILEEEEKKEAERQNERVSIGGAEGSEDRGGRM
jgi:hypothetical protein